MPVCLCTCMCSGVSQYDCGMAEKSGVQVRMPFSLEEEWGGRHRGGDGGAVSWEGWLHPGWTLSPPLSSTSCLTIVPPVQLTNIFAIAGQLSGLETTDMKDTDPCP